MFASSMLRRTATRLRFALPLAVMMMLLTATAAQAAPGTPSTPSVTDGRTLTGSGTGVSLNWSDVSGATCYHVYRSTSSMTARAAVNTTGASCGAAPAGAYGKSNASNFTDSAASGVTKYFYFVVAVKTGASGGTSASSVQVATNTAPTTVADTLSVTEDEIKYASPSSFTANDLVYTGDSTSEAGQELTADLGTNNTHGVSTLTAPAHGAVSIDYYFPFGTFLSYTPADDYTGLDSFQLRVCDDAARKLCSTNTVNVTVTGTNDRPTPANDTFVIDEDTTTDFDVTSNDNRGGTGGFESAQTLTPVNVSTPTSGTVSVVDGKLRYVPAANDNRTISGDVTLTYKVKDNGTPSLTSTSTATVTITINPVDDAPVAADDSVAVDEDVAVSLDVVDNDSAGPADEGQGLEITNLSDPANGTAFVDVDGRVVYQSDLDYVGSDSFTYTVHETDSGDATSETATVSVDVLPINDAPRVTAASATTAEDTAVDLDVLGNDDVGGGADEATSQTLFVGAVISGPADGEITNANANGTGTYTPDADFHGEDVITYSVCDTGVPSLCTVNTVTITVTPVNDAPVASDDAFTIDEDTVGTFDVLANDTTGAANESDRLLATIVDSGSKGTAAADRRDGKITYTPNANANGTDTFTYETYDNGDPSLTSDVVTVTVTINAVNDAPVASDDAFTIDEDTVGTFDVLVNDTTGAANEDDRLLATIVDSGSKGTAAANRRDGKITYTPNANANGTDTFTYQAYDNGDPSLTSDVVTVTVTITAVNDAPVAADDAFATDEDTVGTFDVLANDTRGGGTDEDDQRLLATIVTSGLKGTAAADRRDGKITYTPNANANGVDSFTYRAYDNGDPALESELVTVTVTINAVNDAPVATDDAFATDEDTVGTFDVLANDTSGADDESDRLLATIVDSGSKGTAAANRRDGKITYTPNANANGTDTFTYQAYDNGDPSLTSETVTVTVTINAVNDSPVAADDAFATEEDTVGTFDVLANDTRGGGSDEDAQRLLATIVDAGSKGTAAANRRDGKITYTPNLNANGTDTFTYETYDNGDPSLTSDVVTVTVTINAVNDAPVADADTATTAEDTLVTITDLLDNDTTGGGGDESGQELEITSVQDAVGGTVALVNGTTVTFTPSADLNGPASFSYTVCDDGADEPCDTAAVAVTVTAVNDAPTVLDDAAKTVEGTPVVIDVVANDSAGPVDESNALEPTAVSTPAHGTAVVVDGKITYTPAADYNGTDTFTYQAHETSNGSLTSLTAATVTVQVTPDNTAPVATNGAFSAKEGETTSINLATLADDVETPDANLTYIIDAQPTHGTLSGTGAARTYTSAPGYSGLDTLTFHVVDSGDPDGCGLPGETCTTTLASNVATVTLNVTAKPVVETPPAAPGNADANVDRTKPTVQFVSPLKSSALKIRKNGLTVKVKTNKQARTVVTIYLNVREAKFLGFKTTKPLIIGTGVIEATNGGVQNVVIKLTYKGKAALVRRSRPTLHLAVRVASSNAYGIGNANGTLAVTR